MTWTKLDDGIFDHPKMLRAGEDAANLYVRGLVYCNKHLTDGRIVAEALAVLTRRRDARALAARLVEVNAWEVHPDGGWVVHNFARFNPSADEVEAKRAAISAKRSAAGKQGGLRSGEVRSKEANAKHTDEAKTKPRPVPSRPVQEEQDTLSGAREGTPTGPSGASAPLLLLPDEPEVTSAEHRVFAHWQTATKRPRANLDAKRLRLIRDRLKSYSVEDLCRAIDGYARSAWHQGENDRGKRFDDLGLILRDSAQVEKGWDYEAANPANAAPPAEDFWEKGLRELAELTERKRREREAKGNGGGGDE